MKNIRNILSVALLIIVLQACDKSNDFHEQNAVATGLGYAPISNNAVLDYTFTPPRSIGTSTSGATSYAAGSNIKAELTFFSQSPIKETQFFTTIGTGAKTLTATIPYAPAFSTLKGLDTLLVPYTVPAAPAANTVIRLDFEIINVNGLKAVRTVYVKKV